MVGTISTDGKEVWRSPVQSGDSREAARYSLDLTGVETLVLEVDPTPDGNRDDWGFWLEPTIGR